MNVPDFLDANDEPIDVGSNIDGGGRVVEFRDCDELGWAVLVEWPEWPGDPEMFHASQGPYGTEGDPWRCDDIEQAA